MEIKLTSLTDRQCLIVETLLEGGNLKLNSFGQSVSDDTLLRDIKDLINRNIVRKTGKTKGSKYSLARGCLITTILNVGR